MKPNISLVIVIVIASSVILSTCVQTTKKHTGYNLNDVKLSLSNLTIRAFTYSQKEMGCNVNYSFIVDVLNGKKEIIRFEKVESNCSNKLLYDRLNVSLRNAVLIDTGDSYYLYMPSIYPYVVKYKPQNSIIRYRGLPIVTFYNLVKTFDKARNVEYVGKSRLIVNGSSIDVDVIRYQFDDGLLGNVKVELYVWNKLPIKAVLTVPNYNATIITAIEKYDFNKAEDFNLSAYEIVER
ncbi:hypothetical protein [Archaeoglobus sp.]